MVSVQHNVLSEQRGPPRIGLDALIKPTKDHGQPNHHQDGHNDGSDFVVRANAPANAIGNVNQEPQAAAAQQRCQPAQGGTETGQGGARDEMLEIEAAQHFPPCELSVERFGGKAGDKNEAEQREQAERMDRKATAEEARNTQPVRHAAEAVLEQAVIAPIEGTRIARTLSPVVEALHVHPRHAAATAAGSEERTRFGFGALLQADAALRRLVEVHV
uniref:Uncharacterized protein n=1 Tax=Prymnesium polylepis TaxID=72548 RepID=A0A7S4HFM0_9EUKA|mmetsp:Transcript_1573/g.3328  ORF Transcript_1573/g.3328 Transcript_1573/m.3328 type:complete len:217 (+) Transcript_1573:428-1078(+)